MPTYALDTNGQATDVNVELDHSQWRLCAEVVRAVWSEVSFDVVTIEDWPSDPDEELECIVEVVLDAGRLEREAESRGSTYVEAIASLRGLSYKRQCELAGGML